MRERAGTQPVRSLSADGTRKCPEPSAGWCPGATAKRPDCPRLPPREPPLDTLRCAGAPHQVSEGEAAADRLRPWTRIVATPLPCRRPWRSGSPRLALDQRAAATAPPGPVLCIARPRGERQDGDPRGARRLARRDRHRPGHDRGDHLQRARRGGAGGAARPSVGAVVRTTCVAAKEVAPPALVAQDQAADANVHSAPCCA